jgi:hypothetical protein
MSHSKKKVHEKEKMSDEENFRFYFVMKKVIRKICKKNSRYRNIKLIIIQR